LLEESLGVPLRENLKLPDYRYARQGKERRKSVRLQNLLKWAFAVLFALSGYFVRGWYENVNQKFEQVEHDRASLIILANEVKHLVNNQTRMIEQLNSMNVKLDEIRRK